MHAANGAQNQRAAIVGVLLPLQILQAKGSGTTNILGGVTMFRGGKIPDIEGYQSPIQQYISDMTMKMENDVCTAVQNVGIYVDKEELIKALRYDRQQYDKGYADGYSNGYEQGRKEALESIKEYVNKEV